MYFLVVAWPLASLRPYVSLYVPEYVYLSVYFTVLCHCLCVSFYVPLSVFPSTYVWCICPIGCNVIVMFSYLNSIIVWPPSSGQVRLSVILFMRPSVCACNRQCNPTLFCMRVSIRLWQSHPSYLGTMPAAESDLPYEFIVHRPIVWNSTPYPSIRSYSWISVSRPLPSRTAKIWHS